MLNNSDTIEKVCGISCIRTESLRDNERIGNNSKPTNGTHKFLSTKHAILYKINLTKF